MSRLAPVMLIVAISGCSRCKDSDTKRTEDTMGTTPSDAATNAWPTPSAPTLPPQLAALGWPTSLDDVRAKVAALADEQGFRAAGLTMFLEPDQKAYVPRIWLGRPGINLAVLEKAWGPLTRDTMGNAVWFNPTAHIKARFPARSARATGEEGVELSYYVSTLERVSRAPDELVPGAGPLLGQPAAALDRYSQWIGSKDADAAILFLPAGDWDLGAITVTASIKADRIWRLRLRVEPGPAPIDAKAIRERLEQRWGKPTETTDAGLPAWTYPGTPKVMLRDNRQLEIVYTVD